MEFINTGLDERILKSMDVEHPSEELVKAMNKQGLVQKEVQVKGKNGQVFIRKQWVKASEAKNTSVSQSTTKEKSSKSQNNQIFSPESDFKLKNFKWKDTNVRKYKGDSEDFECEIEGKKIVGVSTDASNVKVGDTIIITNGIHNEAIGIVQSIEKTTLDRNSIHERAGVEFGCICKKSDGTEFSYTTNSANDEEIKIIFNENSKSSTDNSKTIDNSKPSLSDIQGYGYDPSTATGDPTYLKIGDKGYYKIGNNKWQYNPSQGSALGGTYTDSQISDMVSKTSEEVKVIPSSKKNNNNNDTFKDYLEADKAGEADAGKTSKNNKKVIDAVKTQYIDNIYRKGKGMSDSQHESLCKKIAKQCEVSEFDVWYEMTKQFTEFTNESDKKSKLGTTNQKSKDLSKMSESELKDRMKQVTTRMSELSKEMNSNSKAQGQLNSVATQAQKKEYDELVEENGNLMMELGKRKPAQQPTGGQKLSPADAKKKTQEITKGVSDRKSFMEKVKAQGIIWKENDHEGINWMRCCMAMNKHFENGGNFDEK